MYLHTLLESFNYYFTLTLVFPFIVIFGLYLSIRLHFIQFSHLKQSFIYLIKKDENQVGNISRFEAISAVLAGNFGTGNISGMAVALSTGGPGALVWMWLMAFLGAAIQYTSCVLGVAYRHKSPNGEYVGGPMYYLSEGLGYKKTACFFACFTMAGALTVGNFAQINSIVLPLEKMGWDPLVCSCSIACLVGLVIIGGIKRIGSFASYIVPCKALIYLGTTFFILGLHYEKIFPAFELLFQEAFNWSSLFGGTLGFGMLNAIKTGFDRGLFATDAGTGIVPILQASARSKNPIADGITTLIAPLMVMIVCTATGLVLIVTGVWQDSTLQSTNMVTHAFNLGLNSSIGTYIVIASLALFGFTTIIAWSYCGEKALEFLVGEKYTPLFRIVYILLIPLGAILHVYLIWTLADIAITFMLVTNLIGVSLLSGKVIQATSLQNSSIAS